MMTRQAEIFSVDQPCMMDGASSGLTMACLGTVARRLPLKTGIRSVNFAILWTREWRRLLPLRGTGWGNRCYPLGFVRIQPSAMFTRYGLNFHKFTG
jgi:hypothetical protein